MTDVERGRYEALDTVGPQEEEEALLSDNPQPARHISNPSTRASYSLCHLLVSFFLGLACALAFYLFIPLCTTSTHSTSNTKEQLLAPPYVGSSEVHHFPPTAPTNAFPSLFPTKVGYTGATPTGAEPALVITAPSYPVHTGAPHLVGPDLLGVAKGVISSKFDVFKKWGNLSPWYSVGRTTFGLDSGPDPPESCRVTGLHFLHRHGARYPTAWASYGGPTKLASRLHKSAANWTASGTLAFLNEWTYKLGEEVLTPFGRQQMYDLGVSLRIKYGFLLSNFTESNTLPVFRTESQNRMHASAMNFAIGFFGWPVEDQYQQSITIESPDFNNTLAPYYTHVLPNLYRRLVGDVDPTRCPNARIPSKADRAITYVREWTEIYLKDARQRVQEQLEGFELSIEDVYILQQTCAYETVALGYSMFCELFTEEEWEGFEYAMDLSFWYNSAFGSPVARVQGIGYLTELIARLTHTPIETHNTSTNATLNDNPITFPLNNSLYVDATHEVVVLNIITALNLSNFASSGPLPADHIPLDRSFVTSELAPFGTNIQFQVLACSSMPDSQIRIIINDGVTPLTGIKNCPDQKDGMCPVSTFVEAQKQIMRETDWEWSCHGDWAVPQGTAWNTTTGDSPTRKHA